MARIKGKKGFPLSDETKRKIGLANRGVWIKFCCDYCRKENEEKESHFKKKKRHFCNMECYSKFRKEKLPKVEQNAYKGGGMTDSLKKLRISARSITNHAIRDGKLIRPKKCSNCNKKGKIQAHHEDYYEPLVVEWLCIKCHLKKHENHKLIEP